jgi:hypothetical protein
MKKPTREEVFDASVSFVTGIAIEKDFVRIAAYRDSSDPSDISETRLFTYDMQQSGDEWSVYDLDRRIIAMCLWPKAPFGKRAYVSLSWEGHVEIECAGGDPVVDESIADAGLHEEWSKDYGYVFDITAIDDSLYVCGDARQIYLRAKNGQWSHMDVGLLQEGTLSLKATRCLMAIRGSSKENIYSVGTDGEIFHFDGSSWKSIKSGTDEDLLCIKIVNANKVLIGGSNGTLLLGNHKDGFKDLSTYEDNMRISSIEFFEDKIWAASNLGLFTYAEKRSGLLSENTTLIPDLSNVGTLDAADGILWSFGNKEIACFDGRKWKRIDHPDNPPIR